VGFHLAKKLSLTNDYSKCVIPECRGDSFTKGFCRIHYLAYENLLKNYEEWRVRKGISFNDYLSKIAKLKSTGTFVKEVIRYQLEAGKTN
jgi:DNA topoisomerase-1